MNILHDMARALLGLAAHRAIYDLQPETPEHQTACDMYDWWRAWYAEHTPTVPPVESNFFSAWETLS